MISAWWRWQSRNQVVLITRARSFQQARSSIDSEETRGIHRFLESWATFRSRWFLAGRVYRRRVRLHLSLSLSLLFLPLFRHPTSLGMLMSFFRNPSSLIRGTSPARFFVSERMSRLIDEWRTYTLRLWDEWLCWAAVLTCVRGVRSSVSTVSYYTLDTPIFRRIATNTRWRIARQKKELLHRILCRQLRKRILSRRCVARNTCGIHPASS